MDLGSRITVVRSVSPVADPIVAPATPPPGMTADWVLHESAQAALSYLAPRPTVAGDPCHRAIAGVHPLFMASSSFSRATGAAFMRDLSFSNVISGGSAAAPAGSGRRECERRGTIAYNFACAPTPTPPHFQRMNQTHAMRPRQCKLRSRSACSSSR